MSSEDKAMPSAPESGPNRLMRLDYSQYNGHPGPVAIFWDVENCSVPKNAVARDIAYHIKTALGTHYDFSGHVAMFCAYGDFISLANLAKIRKELQVSGVQIVQVSHDGKKDAADKAILVDMLVFAIDMRLPSSVMLISGDADFAPALQALHKRHHPIGIAIPSTLQASADLTGAAEVVWDWPSLACGKGVGIPRPLASPEDLLQLLKDEMIQVLKSSATRSVQFSEIPGAYQKHVRRPLIISHYDATELDDLFKKLGQETFIVFGGGKNKAVYLNMNPALEEDESSLLGSSSQLQDDQASSVPPFMLKDVKCVKKVAVHAPSNMAVDAPTEVDGVETGPRPSSQPVPALLRKRRRRLRQR